MAYGPRSICHQPSAISQFVRGRSHQPLAIREGRRSVGHRPEDFREPTALKELASLAAAAGHFVFARADRLLAAPRRFDRQQIAVAGRRYRAEHLVLWSELDQ